MSQVRARDRTPALARGQGIEPLAVGVTGSNPRERDRTRLPQLWRARAVGGSCIASWDAVDISDSRERYVCSRECMLCYVMLCP